MRKIVKLMEDWQFTYRNQKKRLVDLPHTWNAIDGRAKVILNGVTIMIHDNGYSNTCGKLQAMYNRPKFNNIIPFLFYTAG